MNTLFLRLEGPLQAWGLRARWGERDTADVPTKSGILGLIGCALGLRRDDAYLRTLSDTLRMAVRVDRPGTLLRDYHTTGGGQFGNALHTGGPRFHDQPYAGGVLSPKVNNKGRIYVKINANTDQPETDTSYRYYLADASFLAALQGEPSAVRHCADALQSPVWPVFLGRKSCVPAAPVFAGLGQYDTLEAALAAQPLHPRGETAPRLLIETGPGRGNRQNDNIGVPARRVFLPRYVAELPWPGTTDTAAIDTMEG